MQKLKSTNKYLIFLIPIIVSYLLIYRHLFELDSIINDYDYWFMIGFHFYENDIKFSFSNLFLKGNEHYLIFANFIYYINYVFFSGHNWGLQLFSFLFAYSNCLIIYYLFPNFSKESLLKKLILIFFISFFIFNPQSSYNFFLGFDGIIWFSASAMMLSSIALIKMSKNSEGHKNLLIIAAICIGFIAGFCFSTAIFSLLFISFYIYYSSLPRKYAFISLTLFLVFFIIIIVNFKSPDYHPKFDFDFFSILLLKSGYLFRYCSRNLPIDYIFLLLSFVTSFVFTIKFFRLDKNSRSKISIIIIILLFGYINATLTAITRLGFGIDAGYGSRYAAVSSLFFVAHLYSVYFISKNTKKVFYVNLLNGYLITLAMLVLSNPFNYSASEYIKREVEKVISEAALFNKIYDNDRYKYVIFPGLKWDKKEWENFLFKFKINKHVPFDKVRYCEDELVRQVELSEIDQSQEIKINNIKSENYNIENLSYKMIEGGISSLPRCLVAVQGGFVVGIGRSYKHPISNKKEFALFINDEILDKADVIKDSKITFLIKNQMDDEWLKVSH